MTENLIPQHYGKIVFPGWENKVIENPNTLSLIMGDGNYIYVFFKCGGFEHYPVCLEWIEARLDPALFCRIHKSYIISGSWVTGYSPVGERYQIRCRRGEPLYVSRQRRDDFEEFISAYLPDGYKRNKKYFVIHSEPHTSPGGIVLNLYR